MILPVRHMSVHPGIRAGEIADGHGQRACAPPASGLADESLTDPVHPRHAVQIALWRYNSAMATIQVREVPEELYEVLRRRARRAGQSMQSYMREQLLALAGRPTKEEAIEEIETVLERARTSEPVAASVVADLTADRR